MAVLERHRLQLLKCRPGSLGIHVISRDRRDTAPVVDSGPKQCREVFRQVGRRLDVDFWREDNARHGHGPKVLLGWTGRAEMHRRTGFWQEILHYHLLHVAVGSVRVSDGPKSPEAVFARITDPYEDPRREGYSQPAGGLQGRQPPLRRLVG